MKGLILFGRLAVFGVLGSAIVNRAAGQPPDILRDYRFVTAKSIVHVSGGASNYNLDLNILGKFGLVTGYDYEVSPTAHIPALVPHAEFVDVHAILFNPLSMAPTYVPGWDLDKTLNLSGLKGTFADPALLHFSGVDGQGAPFKLDAALRGPLLHMTGMNFLPPTCATCTQYVGYKIDAVGLLRNSADFNGNGIVDAADYLIWRKSTMSSSMTYNGTQIDISSSDYYDLWRSEFGQRVDESAAGASLSDMAVPEPAVPALLLAVAAFLSIRRCGRCCR